MCENPTKIVFKFLYVFFACKIVVLHFWDVFWTSQTKIPRWNSSMHCYGELKYYNQFNCLLHAHLVFHIILSCLQGCVLTNFFLFLIFNFFAFFHFTYYDRLNKYSHQLTNYSGKYLVYIKTKLLIFILILLLMVWNFLYFW